MFACLVYVLDGSTVSIDVNVSIYIMLDCSIPVDLKEKPWLESRHWHPLER